MRSPVKKILYIGLTLNIGLAILKLVFGFLGNSFSLKVDGLNSLIDIIISGLIIMSLHIASKSQMLIILMVMKSMKLLLT